MKTYIEIPLYNYNQVKPEDLTKNIDKTLEQFNGNLNGNNLPVLSVTSDHLTQPVPQQAVLSGSITQFSSGGASQAYYLSRRSSAFEGASDIWTPLLEIDLEVDTWGKGFNSLSDYTNWNTFPLTFNAKEGMLVGCATIDWEHGVQVYQATVEIEGSPVQVGRSRGNDWWTRWGVFVNNVLVAESGKIFPRRHTTQIPFSVPCGSQNVTVDVRFIASSWRTNDSPSLGAITGTKLNIFSATTWVRNQFR